MHRPLQGPAVPVPTAPTAAAPPPRRAAPGVLRCLLATAACGGLAVLLAVMGASTAAAPYPRLDAMVSTAVLAVGALAAALLTVGCVLLTLTAVALATGRTLSRLERVATRLTPAVLRRAVAVTVSTGIGLGALSGAAAASEIDLGWEITQSSDDPGDAAPTMPVPRPADDVTTPAGLATHGSTAAATPPGPAEEHPTAIVTVQEGDTLWGIAADHLPVGSDDAAVAAAWPLWYEANRDVVGPDPDLIHPGQVLTAPGAP